jgi:hypothetical protein
MPTTRERFEADQLARIAAGWRCQACGAEHGKPHPSAPSRLAFLVVVNERALCRLCAPDLE